MYSQLKEYCKAFVPFSEEELEMIPQNFEIVQLRRLQYLLAGNKICDFVAFVATGSIRHFHIKDGVEKTCDISFKAAWVTDFNSFNLNQQSTINLQALEPSTVILIRKQNLLSLYRRSKNYESFGRLMAEAVAQRATEIAMSLSSSKPEERFTALIKTHADIFQRVPQKYIANFLGISAESLSRIRKRVMLKQKS